MIEGIKYSIGKQYVQGRFKTEESDQVAEAYKTISKINYELFKRIPLNIAFTDEDPYGSSKEMCDNALATGNIRIYTSWSGHPFLTQEENSISRAVHDVFAHLVCGCPFTFQGEYSGYREQRRYYPDWTWNVLFAEIPAQTCAYYYSKGFGYRQRAIEAPMRWLDLCEGLQKDYSKNSVLRRAYLGENDISAKQYA